MCIAFTYKPIFILMAKKTFETTFGTRLQNAQILINNLQSFINYTPLRTEDSAEELKKVIEATQKCNADEATRLQSYTLAVDTRQKAFYSEDKSIRELVTNIMATLRAQYGKDSKEVGSLVELANKTRGVTKRKTTETTDAKKVSTSQQSYASIVQNFADLIASLEALNPAYAPANPDITMEVLKKFLDIARNTSQAVNLAYIELDKVRQTRDSLYKDLNERTQRVKEGVKAQYGTKSKEYEAVKGLTI
jgi:hypothetical protein